MSSIKAMIIACEKIANNGKVQASITDWACARYDELTDRNASVKVSHLTILEKCTCDVEEGLYLIGRDIAGA